MHRARAGLILVAASLLVSACGISFADDPQGNEFWKSLEVSGERRALSIMTATFVYEQFYPVDVPITCDIWRDGGEFLRHIGSTIIPAYPDGGPDVTPFAGNFSFDFVIEAPGKYRVDCYTNADEDNFIREVITIRPAATPEAP